VELGQSLEKTGKKTRQVLRSLIKRGYRTTLKFYLTQTKVGTHKTG